MYVQYIQYDPLGYSLMQTYFSINLLFLLSLKEMVPQLYVISYLMDTRFLLSFNRSAIIIIIDDCTEGTKP